MRTQSYANAEFVGALRHRVRHHAIQADCRQTQRQRGEQAKNPGRQVRRMPFLNATKVKWATLSASLTTTPFPTNVAEDQFIEHFRRNRSHFAG